MSKISIILPVYNGQETIKDTVESLLQQTFTDFELLICIDGSNDDCETIITSFNDIRIKLIQNDLNIGLARTLNRLMSMSHAQSKYIAMAEQDDFYYPNRLQLQYELLEKDKEVGLVSGIAEHFDGQKITSRFPGLLVNGTNYPTNNKENFLLNYCYQSKVVNSCMMFRKQTFLDNGLYFSMHYPGLSVDWSFILRFALVSKIEGLHHTLVRLDRRPNRQSLTTKKELQFKTARELIDNFYFEYPNIISKDDYQKAKTTEHLIELSSKKKTAKLLLFLVYFLQNPIDNRWKNFILKTIK